MSSSIEEQFDPPEWATREEVIKAARHYINYWKIEARQRNAQWLEAIKPRPPAWQPIETAPKDATLIIGWSKGYANPFIVLWTCLHQWDDPKDVFGWVEAEGDWSTGIELTHWTHLPKPPTK